MHVFAQTNLQLINQLPDSGYRLPSLSSLLQRMSWRCGLFTRRFRASGKTFIAHLVTAGASNSCYPEQSGRTEFLVCYCVTVVPATHGKDRQPPQSKGIAENLNLFPCLILYHSCGERKGLKNEPTRF